MGLLAPKVGMRKKQRARELLESGSAHAEPFLSFIPWICLERQIKEPTTPAERETLFQSLGTMNSLNSLGPVVKLMRFFLFSSQKSGTIERYGQQNY